SLFGRRRFRDRRALALGSWRGFLLNRLFLVRLFDGRRFGYWFRLSGRLRRGPVLAQRRGHDRPFADFAGPNPWRDRRRRFRRLPALRLLLLLGTARGFTAFTHRLACHGRQSLDHVGADGMVTQRQVADGAVEIALRVARQIYRGAAFGGQRRNAV